MMSRCHRLNLMRMHRHQVEIPPGEPSLADEGVSRNRTGYFFMEKVLLYRVNTVQHNC